MSHLLLAGVLDPKELISKGSYLLLFGVIFAESGLLIGFFLPGDSLLFTAGAIAAGVFKGVVDANLNIFVVCIGCAIAAVAGDQVGYLIGRKAGPRIFDRKDSRLFRREYVDKAEEFFEKYGARAIVLARFVPIVRTFVPTVAGVSRMDYQRFVKWNVVGGLAWGGFIPVLSYWFGQIKVVQEHFEIAVIGIVLISLLPMIYEVISHRRRSRSEQSAA